MSSRQYPPVAAGLRAGRPGPAQLALATQRNLLLPTADCRLATGFSLVELMIATIILGFGLLMIGAVLPIAWKASIDSAGLTRAQSIAGIARTHIRRVCRVDGSRNLFDLAPFSGLVYDPLFPPDDALDYGTSSSVEGVSYSFLGDWDTSDNWIDLDADGFDDWVPFVHCLHMENWAANRNSVFRFIRMPSRDRSVPEASTLIDAIPVLNVPPPATRLVGIPATLASPVVAAYDPTGALGAPVVKLKDRVFPPIPDALTPQDPQFDDVLAGRRYLWGAFHRITREPESVQAPRYFMMYYATLYRGDAGNRYARQDPMSLPSHPGLPNPPAAPQALSSDEDVVFPIAWRVPLVIIESQSEGIPALAFAGADAADLGTLRQFIALPAAVLPLVAPHPVDNNIVRPAEMFPTGTYFIDEINGNVYRVVEREFLDVDNEIARLTLDQPVTAGDLEFGIAEDGLAGLASATLRNRVVWVYPPAVVATGDRSDDGDPVHFAGPSPVVDIRMEPLTLMP